MSSYCDLAAQVLVEVGHMAWPLEGCMGVQRDASWRDVALGGLNLQNGSQLPEIRMCLCVRMSVCACRHMCMCTYVCALCARMHLSVGMCEDMCVHECTVSACV